MLDIVLTARGYF